MEPSKVLIALELFVLGPRPEPRALLEVLEPLETLELPERPERQGQQEVRDSKPVVSNVRPGRFWPVRSCVETRAIAHSAPSTRSYQMFVKVHLRSSQKYLGPAV